MCNITLETDLEERIKELNCLYGMSQLVEKSGITLEEICQGLVELISQGYKYTELIEARIVFKEQKFLTRNFKRTGHIQSANILVNGKIDGVIEVCYLGEVEMINEDVFLAEEQKLLNALAERLGRIVERKQTEEALKENEKYLKEREQKLLCAAKELQKANEELERFACIASHDLQEPLRAVSSYCQLLKEKEYDKVDEESKRFFDYIIDSNLRMKILIQDLLDYSRVGGSRELFKKVSLGVILPEVLYGFEYKIEEVGANIIIEEDILDIDIYAISFRIKQLFHNLISNSLKFRNKDKLDIRIGCNKDKEDNHWLFYVKDNGIGIEKEYHERIFGVFKRLYSREEYPGTGIGLALCKKIVETHGGKIWVESEKDKGTSVYFTIEKLIDEEE